jgi:hypothetical protein
MTRAEGETLKKGQAILLNETADEWTQGKTFCVEEVKNWGVVCWARATAEDGVHVLVDSDQAFYRADWSQIAGRTTLHEGLRSTDLTGNYPD